MERKKVAISILLGMLIVVLILSSLSSLHTSSTARSGSNFWNSTPTATSSLQEVTFNETGLSNQKWFVTLGPLTVNSTGVSIHFYVSPGNYSFSVVGPLGYSPSMGNGTLTVSNRPIYISIKFEDLSVFVFSEKGLPTGT
ncbi:MAG: hypothetical protein M0Z77_11950, partial [Thermoplasmatales archaeon]|nr:hypothetical protein [Thermoplasmatales archaeon]